MAIYYFRSRTTCWMSLKDERYEKIGSRKLFSWSHWYDGTIIFRCLKRACSAHGEVRCGSKTVVSIGSSGSSDHQKVWASTRVAGDCTKEKCRGQRLVMTAKSGGIVSGASLWRLAYNSRFDRLPVDRMIRIRKTVRDEEFPGDVRDGDRSS